MKKLRNSLTPKKHGANKANAAGGANGVSGVNKNGKSSASDANAQKALIDLAKSLGIKLNTNQLKKLKVGKISDEEMKKLRNTLTPKKEVMNQTPKGWFNIVGTTGLCVSAKNNKGRLVQQTCGDSDDLLWSTEPQGDGIVIKNKTGRVIDNADQNTYNGNQILGNTRNNSPAQIWAVESVGHGDHVHFRNLQRNKCIDDTGRHAVGSVYRLWYCNNDNKNQWFKLAAPVHTDVLPTPADVVLPTPADVVLPTPAPVVLPALPVVGGVYANSPISFFTHTKGDIDIKDCEERPR